MPLDYLITRQPDGTLRVTCQRCRDSHTTKHRAHLDAWRRNHQCTLTQTTRSAA